MWSFEPQKSGKPGPLASAAVLAAALALAGCNVSPLYGPTIEGSPLAADLATISVDAPDSRVEQEIRNKLIFSFNGGAEAGQPSRYDLHLTANVSEAPVGASRVNVAPSYSLAVAASYELTDIASQRIVARGVARGVAAYDRSNQAFANTRARLDAEDRAAASAADEIRLRISAALVAGI
jgi:LPS-assembly lipoprotein